MALLVNTFWCLYNSWLISNVFYFNRAEAAIPSRMSERSVVNKSHRILA
jgi:hypothetical protein